MGSPAITPARERVLEFIRAFPGCVIRDICQGCGFSSSSTAWFHVKALRAAGLVAPQKRNGKAGIRAIVGGTSPEQYRLRLAADLCRRALDQLGDATTIADALTVHDTLTELYDVLRGEG